MRHAVPAFAVALSLSACGGVSGASTPSPSGPSSEVPVPAPQTPAVLTPAERAVPEGTHGPVEPGSVVPVAPGPCGRGAPGLPLPASASTSMGAPFEGHLLGGVPLPWDVEGLRSNAARPNAEGCWGTVETVASLVRAAVEVHRDFADSVVVVNDLSLPAGGPIVHHGSHQAGRDADVLVAYVDAHGAPWPARGVPVDPEGNGVEFGDLLDPSDDVPVKLDGARTWRFVRALVEEDLAGGGTGLQRVFVVEHVRALLLAEAAREHAPRAVVARFEDVTCQPAYPHDDHLHVRFFCSAEDVRAGCRDAAPIYPWHRDALQAAGLDPVPAASPRRTAGPEPRAPEGPAPPPPMHEDVRAFLERRSAWSHAPHPGRRFCR